MVKHECDKCGGERAAALHPTPGQEAFLCTTCGGRVEADNVTTPSERLTERDRVALGIDGEDADPGGDAPDDDPASEG